MDSEDAHQKRGSPESYTWPLVAVVVVILPQLLIPARDRVGPSVLVPIVESIAFSIMLAIAAVPGPVPRGARPVILVLFGVLALANTVAAARLVVLVLDNGKVEGVALTASRLLVAGCWYSGPMWSLSLCSTGNWMEAARLGASPTSPIS